jgi:hypothetical protein
LRVEGDILCESEEQFKKAQEKIIIGYIQMMKKMQIQLDICKTILYK